MKIRAGFLFIFLLCACNSVHRLSIPFADAKAIIESAHAGDGVIRIFFDRNGFIYPDPVVNGTISDGALKKYDSRLAAFYQSCPAIYDEICNANGVTPISDLDSLKASVDPLQRKLIREYITRINKGGNGKTLVLIIHGFNEHPELSTDKYNSARNYELTRDSLTAHFPAKRFLFVEIYWDGFSQENGSRFRPVYALNAVRIWKNAPASASYAGLELRRILSGLHRDTINVITHGQGAGVITNALFNVKRFKEKYYSDPDRWESEINNCFSSKAYKTPTQQYYIGMFAPAIPGPDVFHEYRRRTVDGKDVSSQLYNCHFMVGFNEYDRVASKYRLAAKHFGSTALACNKAELDSTRKIFNYDASIMDYTDFSRYGDDSSQVEHNWRSYLKHAPALNNFLDRTIK